MKQDDSDDVIEQIVREGPIGTWAVTGLATAIVVAIYLLFYFLIYIPRGAVE